MKAKMGRMIPVENKDRRFGSALTYLAMRVEDESGQKEECLLFTEAEIGDARRRAFMNKEDLLKVGPLRDLFD